MLVWLLVGLLISWASVASASIALVNTGSGYDYSAFSATISTAPFSVTTGNLIVCGERNVVVGSPGNPTGVADSAGNTYTSVATKTLGNNATAMSLWVAKNIVGHGANIVTATYTGVVAQRALVCGEYSGLHKTSPVDVTANGSGTGTTLATGTFTTTVANEVLVSFGTSEANPGLTPAASYVEQYDDGAFAMQDRIVSTIQSSVTATMTQGFSLGWGILAVTLKEAAPAAAATRHVSVGTGNWGTAATWDTNQVPGEGSTVTVAAGHTVTYNVSSTANLVEVIVFGTLKWSRATSTLMDVGVLTALPGGTIDIGTAADRIPSGVNATIRLAIVPGAVYTHVHGMANLPPAVHGHGGTIDMHGVNHAKTWVPLSVDAVAGATTVTVVGDITTWASGMQVVITGTNKMMVKGQVDDTVSTPLVTPAGCDVREKQFECLDSSTFQAEVRTIASITGQVITLSAPLQHAHKGTFPRIASVGLLTRNILITSKDTTNNRGQTMIAHGFVVSDSEPLPAIDNPEYVIARIDGVEFAHLARTEPGSYPVHFHRLGNQGANSYLKKSAIHHSKNICVRVHTTNFLLLQDNVCFDILGHGFSTEDATEVYNVFERNLVSRTQHSVPTNPNDTTDQNEGSGFWLNNAKNSVIDNYVSDADAWAYQYAPTLVPSPNGPIGKSVVVVDSGGSPLPAAAVTTMNIIAFTGNKSYGNYFGGLEAINIDTATEQAFVNLHAVDCRVSCFAGFGTKMLFQGLYTLNGQQQEQGDGGFYAPGIVSGLKLSDVPHHRFLNSTVNQMVIGYQFDGTLTFENTDVTRLGSDSYGLGFLWAISADSGIGSMPIHVHQGVPNSTSTHEFYIFDYDGAGQHVKLMPSHTYAPDALNYYTPSRFYGWTGCPTGLEGGVSTALFEGLAIGLDTHCYREARFVAAAKTGAPLRMPIYVTAGARENVQTPFTAGLDVVDAQGVRWMMDRPYMPSPPNYYMPRYGHVDILGYTITDNKTMLGTTAYGGDVRSTLNAKTMYYKFDVPNGDYGVDLHFIEKWQGFNCSWGCGVGTRPLTIKANGVTKLADVDIFAEVGLNVAVRKSFIATVASGNQLVLDFGNKAGFVSGIVICPAATIVNGHCPP